MEGPNEQTRTGTVYDHSRRGRRTQYQRQPDPGTDQIGDLPAIQIGGRSQWRIERTKLEDSIADAYQRTAEAIRRGDLPAGTAD